MKEKFQKKVQNARLYLKKIVLTSCTENRTNNHELFLGYDSTRIIFISRFSFRMLIAKTNIDKVNLIKIIYFFFQIMWFVMWHKVFRCKYTPLTYANFVYGLCDRQKEEWLRGIVFCQMTKTWLIIQLTSTLKMITI